ncbi:hypothetical protein [Wenzhouxiangella marina]|uniref:Uncharacterized protein n=1 Tax=Wenzhouxiangella marina TaxID=1579979 RepID=A0A0K0Y097_9GAMM|nr:hypothetical protein [Wenzhouxiangella marina]AKS43340.1 hypothetical protein WM2015_2987 [Wenzhouxiangella marina]MBB6088545.1 hypothetical protein [Wenzhouxiangella marina]
MNRQTAYSFSRAALLASAALFALPAWSAPKADTHEEFGPEWLVTSLLLGANGHDRDAGWDRRPHRRDERWGRRHDRRSHRAREYASQATAQAHSAHRRGCRVSGPRWSLDWDAHYRWALDARPRELDRETNRRSERLNRCRLNQRYYSRDRWHDHDDGRGGRHDRHGHGHHNRDDHRYDQRRHGRRHRDG